VRMRGHVRFWWITRWVCDRTTTPVTHEHERTFAKKTDKMHTGKHKYIYAL